MASHLAFCHAETIWGALRCNTVSRAIWQIDTSLYSMPGAPLWWNHISGFRIQLNQNHPKKYELLWQGCKKVWPKVKWGCICRIIKDQTDPPSHLQHSLSMAIREIKRRLGRIGLNAHKRGIHWLRFLSGQCPSKVHKCSRNLTASCGIEIWNRNLRGGD